MNTTVVKTKQIALNGSHDYSTNGHDEPQVIPTLSLAEWANKREPVLG